MKLPEPSPEAMRRTLPSDGRNIQRSSSLPGFSITRKRVPATLAGFWKTMTARVPSCPSREYWSTRRSVVVPSFAVIIMRERVETVLASILSRDDRIISSALWAVAEREAAARMAAAMMNRFMRIPPYLSS
jgi:hypothetical protein